LRKYKLERAVKLNEVKFSSARLYEFTPAVEN
jgi:hypothetical protein